MWRGGCSAHGLAERREIPDLGQAAFDTTGEAAEQLPWLTGGKEVVRIAEGVLRSATRHVEG